MTEIESQKLDRKEFLDRAAAERALINDHYDYCLKGVHYLLVVHGAGLVGIFTLFKGVKKNQLELIFWASELLAAGFVLAVVSFVMLLLARIVTITGLMHRLRGEQERRRPTSRSGARIEEFGLFLAWMSTGIVCVLLVEFMRHAKEFFGL